MVRFSSRVARAAFLSLAVGIFAASASAQQLKFTLPFEAHWGPAVLPPGEYTVTGFSGASWPKVLSITGQGQHEVILASVEKSTSQLEGSCLKVIRLGDASAIQELQIQMVGKTFKFEIPKEMRTQLASRETTQQATKIVVRTKS